jgi:predicted Zn-dependent peptidase
VPAVAPAAAGAAHIDDAPTAPVNTTDEVANALERLGALRDQGVVTPEEFEAKKAELLGRL